MKKLSCILPLILAVGLTASLTACSGGGAPASPGTPSAPVAAAVKIRIASDQTDDHFRSQALFQFERDVESMSNGEIDIEVYTNNALGGAPQFGDAVVDGSVEMVTAGMTFANYYGPCAAFDTPFLISTWDDARKVFGSDYARSVFDDMTAQVGVRFLAFDTLGFRAFGSVQPISAMSDFRGIKCRTTTSPVYLKMVENLGANPVAFTLSELFTALEQKACDALELPVGTINSNKYYENAKYILDTKHMLTTGMLIINEKFYQTLSAEQQSILLEAAKMYQNNSCDYCEQYEKDVFDIMSAAGAVIAVPTAEFMEQMRASEEGIVDVIEADYPGSTEIVDNIRNILTQ
ncbi:MAG: TRAP transporter substrate-binding protein [Gracilibacteraceae bacterium]|nr:TRAP transporter substrate-binding protein [Gracilibacteraceae bacterium]